MARTVAPGIRGSSGGDGGGELHDFAIVCVGSMWKSFDLFKDAFVAAATTPHPTAGTRLASFQLLRLTQSSAVGAGWKAAHDAGHALPVDFSANVTVLYAHGA